MARRKPVPEPSLACARCGRRADPSRGTANFCTACGASLQADAAVPRRRAGRRGTEGVVADRYRLVELLGEGGMGRVYKAEHIRMGKTLALKLLREDFAREPAAAERFLAEARAVSRLSHPHTLAVFDFGEVGPQGGLYLAMEYVPGEDLAAALARSGPFAEARAREIGQQILGSLAEAHDAGVVHRDVKPANLMLMRTRAGEDFVKVLDFGIAALRGDSAGGAAAIVGTPAYLAPEQARGAALDGRADLYALGCVLYELVAGRPPFVAPSPMAVVSAHLSQEPPLLASVAPGVSRAFADVVHRALAKRPQDRFPTADAMREALLALAAPSGRVRPPARDLEGDLGLASREDFDALGKQVRALRAGRVAPLALAGALAALAAGAALAWRWDSAYDLLAARAPGLAAALPDALRPASRFDGREHEPNDRPEQANSLPLPPGPEGAAELLGRVGERRGRDAGDADVFRVEVAEAGPRTALVAEWTGAAPGAGIPGLDVALTLHRAPAGATGGAAPLVATADRAGPGGGERLVAAVSRGTYYLAVRERHAPGAPPVERPEDDYRLVVRLSEAAPGAELEPDDPPAPGAGEAEWTALAARNPLRAGAPLRGETSIDDPDVLAAGVDGSPHPALLALVPDPGVALAARLARRGGDPGLAAGDPLAEGLSAPAGAPLLVPLAPSRAAPALLELSALEGAGGYTALALGADPASGEATLALVRALAGASRAAAALELAAGYAETIPGAAARDAVLLEAGRIAEAAAAALGPEGVAAFDPAARRLGEALFEQVDGEVRYLATFERRIGGAGPLAEEAAERAIALAPPCGAEEVSARAEAFLARSPAPAPERAAKARVLAARASEELLRAAPADPALRARAVDAWRAIAAAGGEDVAEASARAGALEAGELPPASGPICR